MGINVGLGINANIIIDFYVNFIILSINNNFTYCKYLNHQLKIMKRENDIKYDYLKMTFKG
jgi:hypothetical protein